MRKRCSLSTRHVSDLSEALCSHEGRSRGGTGGAIDDRRGTAGVEGMYYGVRCRRVDGASLLLTVNFAAGTWKTEK